MENKLNRTDKEKALRTSGKRNFRWISFNIAFNNPYLEI